MQRSLGIVSASRHEGGGPTMTVLEAGALSKPLIASNIPAYVECLRDGVDCLLVHRGDVVAIVATVTRLVEDPPFGLALGQALAKMVTMCYSGIGRASRSE